MLKTGPVPADASFSDLGGNSLLLLRLLSRVEKVFGIRITPAALYANPCALGIVEALQNKEPDALAVLPIQPLGDATLLFGVHVLGDNGPFFRPLAAELRTSQPMFGLTVGLLTRHPYNGAGTSPVLCAAD